MPRKSTYLFLFILIAGQLSAQEIHFSQITHNQLLYNPAQSGMFEGDLRFGGTYRSQGASISVPYTTYTAWGDFRIEPARLKRSAIGIGLAMYSDNAGEGGLRTTSGYLTASFIRGFDRESRFQAALGFSIGMINRSVDFEKLVFDSQWNGTVFDPNIASGEPYVSNSLFAPDFNFGGLLQWQISERLKAVLGGSFHHINKPSLTFYEAENKLENKLIIHGLVFGKLSENLMITPGFHYAAQQGINEMMLGANLHILKEGLGFFGGLWYRYERDVIPHAGLIFDGFLLEISYDVNVSKLHIASNYRGGFEISLCKTLDIGNKRDECYEFF